MTVISLTRPQTSGFLLSDFTQIQSALNGTDTSVVASAASHLTNVSNPHSVTKSQVGLGNVENTALSTWTGSSNLTTIGTITNGTVTNLASSVITANTIVLQSGKALGKITVSTAAASGGSNGDLWLKY